MSTIGQACHTDTQASCEQLPMLLTRLVGPLETHTESFVPPRLGQVVNIAPVHHTRDGCSRFTSAALAVQRCSI